MPEPRPKVEVKSVVEVALVAVRFAKTLVPVKVGLALNTSEPVPVSSVTAVMRLALEGAASHDAIPVASPLIPVDTGSPVALVSTAEDGVPSAGVTSVGEFESTMKPVPLTELASVTPPYVSAPESVVPFVTESVFAETVVPSKVKFAESCKRPPVPAYVTRPLVSEEFEMLVVDALVTDSFARALSKLNADESVNKPPVVMNGMRVVVRLDTVRLVAERLPEKVAFPWTESA